MTPIVYLHGFLGDGRDLAPLAEGVAGHLGDERRHLTPSLPGHGPMPGPLAPGRGNPFFAAVDYLAATLQLEGVTHFHVVGYSMGGRIAYGLLTKYSDRVASAVTIGASPGIADVTERRTRADADRALSARLEAEGLPAFLESWYALPLFDSLREHPGFEALLKRRREGDAHSLAAALRAMSPGVMPDLGADLARTDVPITALAGERDPKYREVVERLAASNPRIRSGTIEGCGHAAHVERPEAVADRVAETIVNARIAREE